MKDGLGAGKNGEFKPQVLLERPTELKARERAYARFWEQARYKMDQNLEKATIELEKIFKNHSRHSQGIRSNFTSFENFRVTQLYERSL